MGYGRRSDEHPAKDVLEWLFENSTGAITEFEEAQLTEESIYEWITSEDSPPRHDPQNQVWDWLMGRREDTWTRPRREARGDEQARIVEALDTLRTLLEEQVAQQSTGGSALRENGLRPRYRAQDCSLREIADGTLGKLPTEAFGELWGEDDPPPTVTPGRDDLDEIIVTRADGTVYHSAARCVRRSSRGLVDGAWASAATTSASSSACRGARARRAPSMSVPTCRAR
ncbi:MAG: hypothetical protein L0Z46_12545 [Nitrospiraceae bacterium]|nr:hypothetical protein [Nitrospiraceae bacterium]